MQENSGFYNVYITYPRGFGYLSEDLKSKVRDHIVKSIKKNCSDEEWARYGAPCMLNELNSNRKALVYFGDNKVEAFIISERFKADNINSYVTIDNFDYQEVSNDGHS